MKQGPEKVSVCDWASKEGAQHEAGRGPLIELHSPPLTWATHKESACFRLHYFGFCAVLHLPYGSLYSLPRVRISPPLYCLVSPSILKTMWTHLSWSYVPYHGGLRKKWGIEQETTPLLTGTSHKWKTETVSSLYMVRASPDGTVKYMGNVIELFIRKRPCNKLSHYK